MDSQSIAKFRRNLLLNNNLFRHQIALFFYFVSFHTQLLINVFNEVISIQDDVVLIDFSLLGFLKG
jgi:hypothetical protein